MFDVGDRIIGLELPDTFYKLAELLEQDQFELLLSKNRIKDMHRKQDISLVYLMNDAVESFLVFHNATITGQYKSEYEGGLLAVLDKKEEEYVLVVHQGDSVITLFFEDLLQQNNLYNYGDLGHFWVKGYEYLRLLEYRLAILRDKCDYLDIDCSTPEERKLAALVEFPPLNYCCYPAVPEKYIVPRQNPWQPSDEAIDLMIEIAKEAGDKLFVHILSYYKKDNSKLMSGFIARMLHRKKHIKIVRILTKKLQKAASIYPVRSFGIENDIQIQKCLEKAKQKKQELKEKGIKVGISSSNSRELIQMVLEAHGILEYFDCITTCCEVKRGKPAPDVYLKTACGLGVEPKACLVFEDVPMGILAGKRAGMKVCAIDDAYSQKQEEQKRELADWYILDYTQLAEEETRREDKA